MAATRDQAARAIRPDADTADAPARDSGQASGLGEQLRHHVADETKRIPAETPAAPPRRGTHGAA